MCSFNMLKLWVFYWLKFDGNQRKKGDTISVSPFKYQFQINSVRITTN